MSTERHLWEFTLKDGSKVTAAYTDAEIEERKKLNLEIKWIDV